VGQNIWSEASRREFLKSVARATAAAGAFVCVSHIADGSEPSDPFPDSTDVESDRVFQQGIASGDPRPDGCLLWTRVATDTTTEVHFQVGDDETFETIVQQGVVVATDDSDFTVRIRLQGLSANRHYWYRFRAAGVSSPVGRTRTAPSPEDDTPVTVAFASCQDYIGRWYYGWRALANYSDEIDFVLFLGDYIYEYERYPQLQEPQEGREIKLPDGLVINEAQGIIAAESLADYREIYRVTRSDKDLRRMHQLCPFVIIWDDHEHANDAWQDHAVDFNGRRGDEKDTARREAATRAWFEHLPVDVEYHPDRGFPDDIVTWRGLRWGRHFELFLTDQRYYRDDHLIPEGPIDPSVGKFLPNSPLGSRTFCIKSEFDKREAIVKPTMLSNHQRDWLTSEMKNSTATWKVWGSGLMVSQFVLDLSKFEKIPPAFRNVFYFKTDQWDGFPSERRLILHELANVENLVVLSADLHGFYAADLYPDFDHPGPDPIGTEFTVAGISSISLQEQVTAVVRSQPLLAATGLGEVAKEIDTNLRGSSPHFAHADSLGYGAAIARFTAERMDVEFIKISGVRQAEWDGEMRTVKFKVLSGHNRIESDV